MTAVEHALRIGIVAIGRNEGERLIRCLTSLKSSRCPVVYVDSGSTDGSPAKATALGAAVVPLDMARAFTAARARAEGVAALEAAHPGLDAVFFIDGDCELESSFLPAAARFLAEHPDYAVACGRRRERFPDASPYNRLIDREWNTPVGEAAACGGDALFRLAAYRAVGGFDPRIIAGEEPELCTRLTFAGFRIMRLDVAMTVHDAALTRVAQWWRRSLRSGMGYAQAWWSTRHLGRHALFGRELGRCIAWAVAVPIACVFLALASGDKRLLLLWPALVLIQAVRVALRKGAFFAALSATEKYAELIGAIRYVMRAMRGDSAPLALNK